MGQSSEKIQSWVIAGTAAICYYTSLGCELVFDDIAAIRDNRDIRPHTPITNVFFNDFWGTPLHKEQSHKSYRPLCILTFRLNYTVHGLQPFGYHLVNVTLHTVVCLLYYRVCLLFLPLLTSFVAAMLFAVHPIHTEAVTGVVGRAELLSALFYLCAFLLYTSRKHCTATEDWRRCLGTTFLAACGMLCKEQALIVMALCCVYEIANARPSEVVQTARYLLLGKGFVSPWIREAVLRITFLLTATIVILYLRVRITGPHFPVFNRFDNPASVASTPTRQLTYNYLLSINAWLLLFPCDLCCDWSMGTVPLVTTFTDFRNLSTLALYLTFFILLRTAYNAVEPHRRTILMSLSMLVLPFLPASNLLFPVGFVVAERVLYLPSMGFCMLVAFGWSLLWAKCCHRKLLAVGLSILLAAHAHKTIRRNEDWKTEVTLFSSALRVNTRNAKLYNNMGQALERLHRKDEALRWYKEATRIQPNDVRGYLNSGRVFTLLRRYHEAEDAYLQAKALLPPPEREVREVHVTPSHLQVFLNLASLIAQNHSRLEEADALYRHAIRLRADYSDAYLNRGDVLLRMNRTKEAEAMYERAIELDGTNPDLYYNLGVVLMDQGRNVEALQLFNKALDIDPEHEKALMNSAVLIQEAGITSQSQIATDRLLKMVTQGKQNERVYFNLGMLALKSKDFNTAENCLRRAIQIKPDLRSALFNMAFLLSELQRPLEAVPYLHQLLQYHPNHIKGLVLLGDIYVNHVRNLDAAEQCYRKILAIDPHNVQGLHNLCVIHVEKGELQDAERCFLHAATLYPRVDYIQRHLQETRNLLQRYSQHFDPNIRLNRDPTMLQQLSSSSETIRRF
ncbi:protein O-mannosyl-transferase Tmtc3-like [Centruroides vittatus]|uniref:protein O-mannosyl-transferase Tmtc3-like n=1 Tax=Centruroides vittatus TaxID=120091 RepID=UPI00350ED315